MTHGRIATTPRDQNKVNNVNKPVGGTLIWRFKNPQTRIPQNEQPPQQKITYITSKKITTEGVFGRADLPATGPSPSQIFTSLFQQTKQFNFNLLHNMVTSASNVDLEED